jgi:hypothetical protein
LIECLRKGRIKTIRAYSKEYEDVVVLSKLGKRNLLLLLLLFFFFFIYTH